MEDMISETDSEQFMREDLEDPYPEDSLRDEAAAGKKTMYLASVWWAHRQSGRRLKAARAQFGPKRNFTGRKSLGKRFTRRGPLKSNGRGGGYDGKSKMNIRAYFKTK